jgi:hypothetical protein
MAGECAVDVELEELYLHDLIHLQDIIFGNRNDVMCMFLPA